MKKVIINGKFPNLNDYVLACRRKAVVGNAMIAKAEKIIIAAINDQLPQRLHTPIRLVYKFYEPNRRRDKDNIAGFFHKVFQDSLTKSGRIKDDGWNYIDNWSDDFEVDKDHARVEVTIIER